MQAVAAQAEQAAGQLLPVDPFPISFTNASYENALLLTTTAMLFLFGAWRIRPSPVSLPEWQ